MSRVLVLLVAWLLLSVPVALLLGRALRQGRTAALHSDPSVRTEPRAPVPLRDGAPIGQGATESPASLQPHLALVDPGTGRSRARPGDPLG